MFPSSSDNSRVPSICWQTSAPLGTEFEFSMQPSEGILISGIALVERETWRVTAQEAVFEGEIERFSVASLPLLALDVSKAPQLELLSCCSCQLEALDVAHNIALDSLICRNNRISSLDISHNINLSTLYCDRNLLKSLEFSDQISLASLNCSYNPFEHPLDVSQLLDLDELSCSGLGLVSLDLSKFPHLTYLECNDNQLTSLDFSHCSCINCVECNNNLLEELVFPIVMDQETAARLDEMSDEELDYWKLTALWSLECSGNRLKRLDLSAHYMLSVLDCNHNALTELKLPPTKYFSQ